MDDERRRAKAMVKALPFKEKVKHYWGYYKRHVIIFVLSALVVAWGVVQCMEVPEYDLKISFYTTTSYKDSNTTKLTEYFKEYVDEINENDSKTVFLQQKVVDITKDILEPEDTVTLSKLVNELGSDEYKVYILDEHFMEHFRTVYSEIIKTVFPMHEIPKMRELMELREGEELYLVIIKMYNYNYDNEEVVAEYKNAEKIEAHMNSLMEKAKK